MSATSSPSLSVPTIDLADLTGGDPEKARKAETDLRLAFGTLGLVYVKGHGIDNAELLRFYDAFRSFVARDAAAKMPYASAQNWYQRGWTPPNTEVAVAAGGQPDFKECYFVAPYDADPDLARQFPELYPPNIFPNPAVPGFEEGFIKLGRSLHEAGTVLLRGCARALGLEAEAFTKLAAKGAHVTRVLNYLPLEEKQVGSGILWGEEHTDFNMLTLLPGGRFYDPSGKPAAPPDDKSGLFLRTRATAEHPQGRQVRGRAPEGCITVQVGQQLEILTGGALLATPHVITAPGVAAWSRLSSAHFVHVSADEVLYPLPAFRNEKSMRDYGPPALAGTYAIKTLVDIGLAPKSALERLGYRHYDRLDTMRAHGQSAS